MSDSHSSNSGSGHSGQAASMTSIMMTPKQYFMVNFSKFIFELCGTTIMGILYLTVASQQVGMLLGFWIITLFGYAITGSHFNPCVTLVAMLRKNSNFGSRRLLGIIYLIAQFLGGLLAAAISKFLINDSDSGSNTAISPFMVLDGDGELKYRIGASMTSELSGTFLFVFMIMISTDKETAFSNDKVINCFIMASSYVSARLIAGGSMVTVLYSSNEQFIDDVLLPRTGIHPLGPLLNPALAFGQMLFSFDFSSFIPYLCMPIAGSACAILFYELIFVKSQNYVNDDDSNSEGKEFGLDIDSPEQARKKAGSTGSDKEDTE